MKKNVLAVATVLLLSLSLFYAVSTYGGEAHAAPPSPQTTIQSQQPGEGLCPVSVVTTIGTTFLCKGEKRSFRYITMINNHSSSKVKFGDDTLKKSFSIKPGEIKYFMGDDGVVEVKG